MGYTHISTERQKKNACKTFSENSYLKGKEGDRKITLQHILGRGEADGNW
jgi:hypothetical protein